MALFFKMLTYFLLEQEVRDLKHLKMLVVFLKGTLDAKFSFMVFEYKPLLAVCGPYNKTTIFSALEQLWQQPLVRNAGVL